MPESKESSMLASLLPGLRDLRTPLATGYLWLVVIWLVAHQYVPLTIQQAPPPLKPLFQLGSVLGTSAVLAALSFVAYVMGSLLAFKVSWSYKAYILPSGSVYVPDIAGDGTKPLTPSRTKSKKRWKVLKKVVPWTLHWLRPFTLTSHRQNVLYRQLDTFVTPKIREYERTLKASDHHEILESRLTGSPYLDDDSEDDEIPSDELEELYVQAVAQELDFVGIQLQTSSKDLWDTFDRKDAESEFRAAISPPILAISLILTWQQSPFWLFLLIVPIALLFFAIRLRTETAATLVQALVLNFATPPVLAELKEHEERKKPNFPETTQETKEEGKGPTQADDGSKKVTAVSGPKAVRQERKK
jgi:hypothetical protein